LVLQKRVFILVHGKPESATDKMSGGNAQKGASPGSLNLLRLGVTFALVLGAIALCILVVSQASRIKADEMALAEINDVKYGLLDADKWVAQISAILERRIDEFELTEKNKPALKRNVERILDRLLIEIDAYQRRQSESGATLLDRIGGTLRRGLQDLFLDLDALREKVPIYAEKVLEELAKPEAKADIKAQLKAALSSMIDSTFARTDRSAFEAVLDKYGCTDSEHCRALLQGRIAQTRQTVRQQTMALIGVAAAIFVAVLYRSRGLSQAQMLAMTLATLILLAGGIMTPMIGIEAKVESLRMQLLGEPLVFEHQVLYFQSKSVTDVVRVLIETGEVDMLLVGVLIALFSVVFPSIKVAASYLYYHDYRGLRDQAQVRFFALKSGKWSMADVMVVAMLMAFIGFRGLVSNQLGSLSGLHDTVEVLTTNGTRLDVGFYLFLSFTIASLLVSTVLDERLKEQHLT
jgi:hypothetical protein